MTVQLTQFVLEAPVARTVSVVGSFNDWDPQATPLVKAQEDGVWSVTVPLLPGRHRYAFMVDDSVWTLDPRALRAPDPDFGVESSVVMVSRGGSRP
jgi:1,4-alpha-glucan branching enzyme